MSGIPLKQKFINLQKLTVVFLTQDNFFTWPTWIFAYYETCFWITSNMIFSRKNILVLAKRVRFNRSPDYAFCCLILFEHNFLFFPIEKCLHDFLSFQNMFLQERIMQMINDKNNFFYDCLNLLDHPRQKRFFEKKRLIFFLKQNCALVTGSP